MFLFAFSHPPPATAPAGAQSDIRPPPKGMRRQLLSLLHQHRCRQQCLRRMRSQGRFGEGPRGSLRAHLTLLHMRPLLLQCRLRGHFSICPGSAAAVSVAAETRLQPGGIPTEPAVKATRAAAKIWDEVHQRKGEGEGRTKSRQPRMCHVCEKWMGWQNIET